MAAEIHHPHDSFFKETFGRPEVAGDFLHHYMPGEITAHLNLDELEQQQGTFIDPDLQEHFSDLLYRVPLRWHDQGDDVGGGGDVASGSAYVYILFEHKSSPDQQVAFQLLRYME